MAVKLYDAAGKVIPGAREQVMQIKAAGGFRAAGTGRRAQGWYPPSNSLNSILHAEGDQMSRRSRDAFRNGPWGKSASDHYVSAVVGSGIIPEFDVQSSTLREDLTDLWDEFSDNCDVLGASDIYGLQEIACRGHYEAGDAFGRLRNRRPTDGLTVPLQIEMLDAEMCDSTKNVMLKNGGVIRSGIEISPIGRKVAYWMYPYHPGDTVHLDAFRANISRRVPSDNVLQVYHPLQAQQVRGVPGLSSVLSMLKDLEDTSDAYVLRKKISNLFATFEQTPEADSVLDAPTKGDDVGSAADDTDDDDVPIRAVEPGSHIVMAPGNELKFTTPPTDSADYEDFLRGTLRGIAVGAGITYEQLTGDLRQVNFSSIRAGLIEFRRMMEARLHRIMIFQFCKPVYRAFIETAILARAISIPEAEMRRVMRPVWIGTPGFEYVDPDKEVKADVRAVRAGFKSTTEVVARGGRRRWRLLEEIKREREEADEAGMVFDTDPAAVANLEGEGNTGDVGGEGEGGEAGSGMGSA